MKKITAILLAALMTVTLFAGCSSGNTAATTPAASAAASAAPSAVETAKPLNIGYCAQNLSNVYFVDYANALKYNAGLEGWNITVIDGGNDAAKQVSAIENWIVQKIDVIIISPVDPVAIKAVVKQAMDAGIVVINNDTPMEEYSIRLGKDEYQYGYLCGKMAAEYINANLNGEAEILILEKPINASLISRVEGMTKALTDLAPKAKIVSKIAASNNEDGMRAAETTLQAYPGLDIVCGINDAGVLGAFEALKAAGKGVNDCACFGLDATSAAIEQIAAGTMYKGTVDVNSFGISEMLVQALKDFKAGTLKDPKIVTPLIEVTSQNVEEIVERNSGNTDKLKTVK